MQVNERRNRSIESTIKGDAEAFDAEGGRMNEVVRMQRAEETQSKTSEELRVPCLK